MKRALATYLGCALIAAYVIVRAWDRIHGRPPEPAELPQPPYVPPSDDGGPVSIRWRH